MPARKRKRKKTTQCEPLIMYKIRSGYGMNFVCCDCGLVHHMWLKASGKSWIEFMCIRNNRLTVLRRRGKALRRTIRNLLRGVTRAC